MHEFICGYTSATIFWTLYLSWVWSPCTMVWRGCQESGSFLHDHIIIVDLPAACSCWESSIIQHPRGVLLYSAWMTDHRGSSLNLLDILSFCCIICFKLINCVHKDSHMLSNNSLGYLISAMFSWFQNLPRKHSTNHYTSSSSSLNYWLKAGWVHGFVLLKPNYDSTICMSWFIRPGGISPTCNCPVSVHCCHSYLLLADWSAR